MKITIMGPDTYMDEYLYLFDEAGIEYVKTTTMEEALTVMDGSTIFLHYGEPMDRAYVERMPEGVKYVISAFVGFDDMDLEALSERGIVVCNNPRYGSREVATLAISMIMDLNRNLTWFNNKMHSEGWNRGQYYYGPYRSRRLTELTLGVVGFGNIGTFTAKMAKGLGMNVIVCDPAIAPSKFDTLDVKQVTFDELLAQSDIITLHIPMSEENKHIINRETIAKMKDGILFVNTARGGLVDDDALIEALNSGKIVAAGLDAFVPEPLNADHPYYKMDNVLLTPHTAWLTEESEADVDKLCAELCLIASKGEVPYSCVNKKQLGL